MLTRQFCVSGLFFCFVFVCGLFLLFVWFFVLLVFCLCFACSLFNGVVTASKDCVVGPMAALRLGSSTRREGGYSATQWLQLIRVMHQWDGMIDLAKAKRRWTGKKICCCFAVVCEENANLVRGFAFRPGSFSCCFP